MNAVFGSAAGPVQPARGGSPKRLVSAALLVTVATLAVNGATALATSVGGQTSALPQAAAPAIIQLLAPYPKTCLTRVRPVSGAGLVAAYRNNRITIGSPGDFRRTAISAHLDAVVGARLGWSADGRYLATGDGRLWTAEGLARGRLLAGLSGDWTWSPTSDCAVGATGPQPSGFGPAILSVGVPGLDSRPFLRGDISSVAFTPDGQSLIVVAIVGTAPPVRASLWRVDLVRNTLTRLYLFPAGTCCVTLGGWAPDGQTLLYWPAPGGSVAADGWPLSGLNISRPSVPVAYGTPSRPTGTLPSPDFVARCGSRLLAVVGNGRLGRTLADKRLAIVSPGVAAQYLTPGRYADLWPACSADGRLIATVRAANGASSTEGRLAVLTSAGTFVRWVTPPGAYRDGHPEWATAGIIVERAPILGATQLWFEPHGSSARDIGMRSVAWDWSATPPSGLF
jgi:hypothetical protein